MDMMHADLCTNATYVGLADVDTLFTTAVTPSPVTEAGNRERFFVFVVTKINYIHTFIPRPRGAF